MKRYQCGGNDMGDIIKINNDKLTPVDESQGLVEITEGLLLDARSSLAKRKQ